MSTPQAKVLVDLSRVDYISSAGLRALMIASKQSRATNSSLVVAGLSPLVKEIFTISRCSDVLAVYDATAEAVARARAGDGPSLIEGVTMRMHGHAEHDPADYVPRELLEEWQKRDPVMLFENSLLSSGVIDEETAKNIRESARKKAIDARKTVLAAPLPDPATVEEGVYAD